MKKEDVYICNLIGIKLPCSLLFASAERVSNACNGVGADWMPDWIRKVLDTRFQPFHYAVLKHDWLYTHPDGLTRQEIDTMFYEDCVLCAHYHSQKWYQVLRRLFLRKDAKILYMCVKNFGKKAFDDAFEKRRSEIL